MASVPELGKELFRRDLSDAEMAELEERVEASEKEALDLAAEAESAYRATGLPQPQWPRPQPRRFFLRGWFLSLASATLLLALLWTWQPQPRLLPPAREASELRDAALLGQRYLVRLKSKPVLVLERRPGTLRSTAALEPGQSPPQHPFVDAQALDPLQEDALRRMLLASKDFDDFVRRLKDAGYSLEPVLPAGAGGKR